MTASSWGRSAAERVATEGAEAAVKVAASEEEDAGERGGNGGDGGAGGSEGGEGGLRRG